MYNKFINFIKISLILIIGILDAVAMITKISDIRKHSRNSHSAILKIINDRRHCRLNDNMFGNHNHINHIAEGEHTDNNHIDNHNAHTSPSQRPIGVLDPLQGCAWEVPKPRGVGAPKPSAASVRGKLSPSPQLNRCQGHGDLVYTMDPVDAFAIMPNDAMIRAVGRPGF